MLNIKNIKRWPLIAVLLIVAAVYVPSLFRPPALMDDVDAAEAVQARNMLMSGDWITQSLNGVPYFDKAPLKYWITAALYKSIGTYDWVARLPTVFAVLGLCLLVTRWTNFYSGLVLATSIGLFLFTRTIIPDALLTLFIAAALWCVFDLTERDTPSLGRTLGFYICLACAVLTKGLIGLVLPVTVMLVYLAFVRRLHVLRPHFLPGLLTFLVIAVPWHVLATLSNPPFLDFSLNPGAHFGGRFRGFFWFYFVNEQLLRFLNRRWPHDYNTVPRIWFWLSHLVWFFPWSVFLIRAKKLAYSIQTYAGRFHLFLLCWIGVVLVFFTFSTTQEYYSLPLYPALAMLMGRCIESQASENQPLHRFIAGSFVFLGLALAASLLFVLPLPAPGDIYQALSHHPDLYTLSLGHMADLTFPALAYLKLPLAIAAAAFLLGSVILLIVPGKYQYFGIAATLVVFFQAARLAQVAFDPYLSSHVIAEKLNELPPGVVVFCGKYNPLSSIAFYARDKVLQNDTDLDILEYGSLAPGVAKIQISDDQMKGLWNSSRKVYIVAKAPKLPHVFGMLHPDARRLILRSGDKYLFAN